MVAGRDWAGVERGRRFRHTKKSPGPTMGGTILARHSSHCPVCGGSIHQGDEISPTKRGYAHTRCPKQRARADARTLLVGHDASPNGMLNRADATG